MIKLNLGSGSVYKDGYINIDLYADNVDLKHDIRKPLPYKDNSVDEIYASHLIEHFTRKEWEEVRKDWYRVLKPNGLLHIKCPDLEQICKSFINDKDIRYDNPRTGISLIMMIYGGQEAFGKGQIHKNGFTLDKLGSDLELTGFQIETKEAKNDIYELEVKCRKPQ